MKDNLVEAIFAAMRNQPVSVEERWRAVMRAGKIAEAYRYENAELLTPIFGADILQDDGEANAVGFRNCTH